MKNLIIRPLNSSELNILEDMLYEAVFVPEGADPFPRDIITDPSISLYIDSFGSKPDDYCFVADCDRCIVGAVWVRLLAGEPRGYGNIDNSTLEFAISLYKPYRNKGIGTLLMMEMISYLKQRGYAQVSLSVQKDNYAARMYKNLGFEIIRENSEDFIMLLKLK